jgi:hypothetical protein
VDKLNAATTPERLRLFVATGAERSARDILPSCSLAAGEPVIGTTIIDLDG